MGLQPIGQGCGCGLINDTTDFEPRNLPRGLCTLPLGIGEVGRDCEHCGLDILVKEPFRTGTEVTKHQGAELLGEEQGGRV
mmetsp:Transcript_29066/g.40200  ORF Transcript_29066/g.40200 Transcript_29066/m.40200 type:complete len:81 (-) Transcript_29066:480-722(-)